MATSKLTPDRDAIVAEIHIAAPPGRVFQALVDPQQVLKWWGQQGVYRSTGFQSDLRRGGKWRAAGVNAEGGNFEVSGEYLEIEAPHLLVYSWVASWTGDAKTTVRWELHPTRRALSSDSVITGSLPIPNWPRATAAGRECWAGLKRSSCAAKLSTIDNPLKQTDVRGAGHSGYRSQPQRVPERQLLSPRRSDLNPPPGDWLTVFDSVASSPFLRVSSELATRFQFRDDHCL